MVQEVRMTKEEKMAMYMSCKKKELAAMVIECNRLLDIFTKNNYENIDRYPSQNTQT